MKMAPQDNPMEPRPTPRWPRGTCFAWELLRVVAKARCSTAPGLCCVWNEEPSECMIIRREWTSREPQTKRNLIAYAV